MKQKKTLARVLVVEDNATISSLMKRALAMSLIDATIATSAEEAFAQLDDKIFDLILLDIDLPTISGIEICRKLKADERLKSIPVIFVTGETEIAYKEEAKRLGALDYIEKPFVVMDFLSRVMGHLNLKKNGVRDVRQSLPIPSA